jgi:hypothetical protein
MYKEKKTKTGPTFACDSLVESHDVISDGFKMTGGGGSDRTAAANLINIDEHHLCGRNVIYIDGVERHL